MKSVVTPFGGVNHFLVYLNEDVGEDKEADKEWIGKVDIKNGELRLCKNLFFLNPSSYLIGTLDPENPEFQLIIEYHESSWNDLTTILFSIGLLVGGGGTLIDGLGMYAIIGSVISLGSLVIPFLGNGLLKKEFDAYLEKYEKYVYLNLKDAHYRQKRWGKK
jgi:hypothetical protein